MRPTIWVGIALYAIAMEAVAFVAVPWAARRGGPEAVMFGQRSDERWPTVE
jgi:hypothetical protein